MKIGIIGCGKQAPKHISGLLSRENVEIVVADLDDAPAKALADASGDKVSAAASIDALFSDPSIVGVSICTPTGSHADLIVRAAENGKHALCEKPLASSIDEGRKAADAVAKAGTVGAIGFIYRFAPAFEQAKAMLGPENQEADSEVLGRVSNAFLRIGGRGSHMIWKHKRETGGGAINEMLVHMLDLSHWFFGPIAKIEDLVTTTKWASREIEGQTVDVDTEDYVLLRATTKSGVEVLVQADMITPAFTQYAEIQGENGSFFGSIQGDMPDFVFCTKPAGAYLGGKNALQPGNSNLFQGQMTNFLDAIEGKAAPRCSVQDAMKTMELTAEIRQRAGL